MALLYNLLIEVVAAERELYLDLQVVLGAARVDRRVVRGCGRDHMIQLVIVDVHLGQLIGDKLVGQVGQVVIRVGFVVGVLLRWRLVPVGEEAEDAPRALARLLSRSLVMFLVFCFIHVLALLLKVDNLIVFTIFFAHGLLIARVTRRIRTLIPLTGLLLRLECKSLTLPLTILTHFQLLKLLVDLELVLAIITADILIV